MNKHNDGNPKGIRKFLSKRNVIRLVGVVILVGFVGFAAQSIYSLSGEVKLKETKLNDLNIELNTVNDQLESLKSDLDKSKESDNAKQQKIEQLEAEKATLESEKADLQSQLQAKLEQKQRLAKASTLSNTASAQSGSSSSSSSGSSSSSSSGGREVVSRENCYKWIGQAGVPAHEQDAAYQLIMRESSCNPYARNPTTGAYGIPQALPGNKMSSMGKDWKYAPITQIRWMQEYVYSRYGGFQNALNFQIANGWY